MTTSLPIERRSKAKGILFSVGRYFGWYLIGIFACITFTPVEMVLIDAPMWLFFVPFAPIGYFFFYFDLPPQYVFGSNISYWTVYVIGIVLVLLGFASHFLAEGRFRAWSPLMVGFPLGFVGTLGVYYTVAASI
ncbi:hypothetical protein [uncultured Boseongicola sp.]|jgi:hypothetical protein|uniref:hypothetical protein n=1 Tax=uncultured Boseongicola sp. TaxID=1648499 RepID=UPI0026369749|nr:hypothetical protein [uncultured Boseongicola sp.]